MPTETVPAASTDEILHVPLEAIDPCVHQSREEFDEAAEIGLADSLKTFGQLQPGVAWFDAGRGRFVLICGERRWRALRRTGKPTMALKVIPGSLTPGQMLAMNLAENLKRSDLNPIERGKAFKRLMQLEDLTASEVAARMSVSNATVSRDLAVLELPEGLQAEVAAGRLPATVAASLARLDDDDARRELADQYASGQLNRSAVAAEVNQQLNATKPQKKPLAFRHGGLAVSVSGKPDKLTYDTLLSVLGRICKEARSLKDAGKTDLAELVGVLKAS